MVSNDDAQDLYIRKMLQGTGGEVGGFEQQTIVPLWKRPALASNDDGAEGVWEKQTIVLEVPNDKVGLVIGKTDSTIKEMEQRSGARVQVTPDSNWQGRSELRPIQLTGTQHCDNISSTGARVSYPRKLTCPSSS